MEALGAKRTNDMDASTIKKNYSKLGSALIEKLYSTDYLSIGGNESTDLLANLAGITTNSCVLDIGSGLGGPALWLAETRQCRVTGIDLVASNVEEANDRAKSRGLDHLVNFECGDATVMDINSASFDVVWGQDAWCHIPDKARLIVACSGLLEQGGTIAFTDWVETKTMNNARRAELHEATASTNMATITQYSSYLEEGGFSILERSDISSTFVEQYRAVIERLEGFKSEITDQFGNKVYDIMMAKNGAILHGFEGGMIGGCRLVGRKL